MHQLIRVLVPGTTQDDALVCAHSALDKLVGVGVDTASVYDYYGTFDQSDSRYKPHVANVISDGSSETVDETTVAPAFPLDSDEGQALLDDALEEQTEEFRDTLSRFQSKVEDLSVEGVMNNVDGVRFHLGQLAECRGPSVYIYNEYGGGLVSPTAVDEYVDRLQNASSGTVGGDGDAAAATKEDEQMSRGWLVPADVHF
ncbi:hypothetical protein [Halobellus ordinarius]|uniref:hypothetical protein n=1 Tax=Halobellus ordinarius TaxID=3075120 RepID=UPI002880A906|nr:hypothetical protein [Halobellus sp. ZY16]